MMTEKEIDELVEAKVAAALKAAQPKPAEPFVPEPYTPFDPTAGMSMPPSALREMANAIPDRMVHDIAMRDARAPVGPSSQGVVSSSQGLSNVRGTGGNTSGWAHEVPISSPPGVAMVDAIMIADDVRQRAELARKMKG